MDTPLGALVPSSMTSPYAQPERAAARARLAGLTARNAPPAELAAARRALAAARLKALLLAGLNEVETLITGETTAGEDEC
ncbi:hypothetical protein AB0O22_12860 [Streptomyces sp. NPDC091204]|uniref:hypothetical protein n=1 Tax=Streptomyces sp. NPDC091204 TaxID=3155299 RepID=UPI00343BA1A3